MRDLAAQLTIRKVFPSDAHAWETLRSALWPDGTADHAVEIAKFFAGILEEPTAVLVAVDAFNKMVAFAELSIRTDIPGLEAKQVGYIEGLYVTPEFRHKGIAKKLLGASRAWARQKNCTAFASDRAGRLIFDKRF